MANCINSNSWKRWCMLTLIMGSTIGTGMVYSLPAPFYPAEAHRKGVSQVEVGLVMGSYTLGVFLFSVPVGYCVTFVGPSCGFCIGLLLLSVTTALFGCLKFINPYFAFLTLSFVIRILEAFSQVLIQNSFMAVIQFLCPETSTTVVGWTETFFGIGMLAGPWLGGFLFDVGDFVVPFFVVGGYLFVLCIFSIVLATVDKNNKANENCSEEKPKLVDIIRIPNVWIGVVFNAMVMLFNLGFLQPTLEPHVRPLNMTGAELGFIFFLNGVGYSLSVPIWGYISEKKGCPITLIVLGAMISIVGLGMLGPIPWIGTGPTTTLVMIGSVTTGVGMGGNSIPTLPQMQLACKEQSIPDTASTRSVVNSMWIAAFSFGGFLGPIVGSILSSTFGFRMASFIALLLYTIPTLVIFPLAFRELSQK